MHHQKALTMRIIGFVGSVVLTLAAFFIIYHPTLYGMGIKTVITIIFILALLQFVVQFIFFIDIWQEKGPPWNLAIFFSTLFIVLTIIVFSIWIMSELNNHMMCHGCGA